MMAGWKRSGLLVVAVLMSFVLSGCALMAPPQQERSATTLRWEEGALIWHDEFKFTPPPAPWQLIDLNEEDFSIAYMKLCNDGSPCQSTFAYAEEPFGYSREFHERQEEFFKRFLWASRVIFAPAKLEKTQVFGREGLIAVTEGIEPVLGHKVHARIIFAQRGERIVAFFFTQWRSADRDYDLRDEQDFNRFIETFEYLRPSFYEQL